MARTRHTESVPSETWQFRWDWRPYQERVLAQADTHLADGRLHLVAAPGAGKTSLGLELVRRLGRPALVLTPTRTIRDQWVARLADFDPACAARPAWCSLDVDAPGFLTVVTYQALHARAQADEGEEPTDEGEGDATPTAGELERVALRLREAGVGTLVLDEAHHLHQGWWKALSDLLAGLDDVRRVSLTGTPPYDVTGRNWARYLDLCGPIDEEISTPELVRAGTLCAHQDFVQAVTVEGREREALRAHDGAVAALLADVLADDELLAGARAHPFVATPAPATEVVLARPELAVALASYLRARGVRAPRGLVRLLGVRPRDLPVFDARWLEVLLAAYLERGEWPAAASSSEQKRALRARLKQAGLWSHGRPDLAGARALARLLAFSRSKVDACASIAAHERELRKERLRMVVLTDYIGDPGGVAGEERLGAWPVFSALLAASADTDVGLVTGRLALVPRVHEAALAAGLEPGAKVEFQAFDPAPDCVRVRAESSGVLVRAFTRLLARGELRVLVGTRSLLGEGWDAPAVNVLVLASSVGAYVTTNQMRGRAIRVDRADPAKAASLWHLVAVDPGTPSGMDDLIELERRFATFVGLSERESALESGLARLDLPGLHSPERVARFNEHQRERSRDLSDLSGRWRAAVDDAQVGRVLPTLRTNARPLPRSFVLARTLRWVLVEAGCAFAVVFGQGLRHAASAPGPELAGTLLVAAALTAALVSLPAFLRAFVLFVRHLPPDGAVRQAALALRDALVAARLVQTPRRLLKVRTRAFPDGSFDVTLAGGTFVEQSLFVDCLTELFAPIENPRYLLTRRGRGLFRRRIDLHAVPAVLGVNKQRAELLRRPWARRLGPARLVYTRHEEGRLELLRARARAFSTAIQPLAERRDRWH